MKDAITTLCILGAFCCLLFGDEKTRILRAAMTFGMLILLALLCAGCTGNPDRYDEEAQKEYFFECLSKLPIGVGSKAVEECSGSSIMWGMHKAKEKNKQKNRVTQ